VFSDPCEVLSIDISLDIQQDITIYNLSWTERFESLNRYLGSRASGSPPNTSSLNLILRDAGTFDIQLNATQLTPQLSSAGSAHLRSAVTNHTATLTGVGTRRSYELQTETASIAVTGVGSAEVTALENLVVSITGTGSVTITVAPDK
jgi:hypothetical protein